MKTFSSAQGSDAWKAERAGIITASNFELARRKNKKGEWYQDTQSYAFRLALERIGGAPLDDGIDTWAMKRGRELEPAGRARLAKALGVEIETAGFCASDCGLFGASPDGFIGTDGGCEIKCLVDPQRIARVVVSNDLSDFMDQMQGCMWITGRKWWEYALYLPQLDKAGRSLYHKRVMRDDAWIADMERDLMEFDGLVCDQMNALKRNLQVEAKEVF